VLRNLKEKRFSKILYIQLIKKLKIQCNAHISIKYFYIDSLTCALNISLVLLINILKTFVNISMLLMNWDVIDHVKNFRLKYLGVNINANVMVLLFPAIFFLCVLYGSV